MSIPPNYDIFINSDSNIVISHPESDDDTYKYLEDNLKSDEVIAVFQATTGGVNYISKKRNQWLVNNYSGIKDVIIKFSDNHDIKISKSVEKLIN
ncbi:hypothetical protein [Fodinibius sp. Rm-B-1B1-1]|uniref:hypothetical protein n=1 Tax=Fodinibius alkaliphilus TaxID=3140241 RepID=UPI00315B29DA